MGVINKHKVFQDVVETAGIPPQFYRIFPPLKFPITTHIRLLDMGYKNAELADLPEKFLDNSERLRPEAPRWGVLQYMLSGQMKFIDCGRELWVEPGQAVLFTIPSETSYYDSTDPCAKWFFLTFSGKTAMAIADELIKANGCILNGLEHSRLVPMAAQMFSMVTAHTPPPFFEFSAVLYHILMELSTQVLSYRKNYPEPVAYALELMDRQFGDADFSLGNLAAAVCLSKYYFSRIFKEHIGENPGAYLHRKRMQTAMDLLLHSNKPIKEIQYLCGFKKYNYFLTAFRKAYGISPGNVRAK
jgi:AraC-like DNA-binding protein